MKYIYVQKFIFSLTKYNIFLTSKGLSPLIIQDIIVKYLRARTYDYANNVEKYYQ